MGKIWSALFIILVSASALFPVRASAQLSDVITKPFGGRIFAIMYLPLFCPPHIVIDDLVGGDIPGVGKKIGIIPLGRLYQYYNVFTPRVWTLGNHLEAPIICPGYPYKIYKMTIMGTSEVP